ncbi:phosphatase PAP2 family protein [Methyloligella solikamskensis]|uniref:Phosphatase PAP2 family protein n=1 Tax=Methyloligella solikamskensis TaxID=1177756 RepID=A0ABW3J6Z8_9HYPH
MQDRSGGQTFSGIRQSVAAMPMRDKAIIVGSLIAFGMFFLDPLVLHWARELDPNVRHIFWTITDVGKSGWVLILSGTAVLAFVALGYRANHKRLRIGRLYAGQIAAFIFLSVATTGLFAAFCKLAIGRARPRLYDEVGSFHFSPFAFDADVASFPSGHATTTFALATALALLWPRFAVPLFTAAVWIAASRFLMGAHYVSDVVAGAFVGTVGTLLLRELMCEHRTLFKRSDGGPCLRGRRVASRSRGSLLPQWALSPSEWLDRVAPERTALGQSPDGSSPPSLEKPAEPRSEKSESDMGARLQCRPMIPPQSQSHRLHTVSTP